MATFAERITQLQGGANIIGVRTKSDPARVSGWDNLWTAQLEYVTQADGVATQNAVALVGVDADNDGTAEAWYWAHRLPEPLKTPTVYFAARTASTITAAQIQSFANVVWRGRVATAADIRDFQVQPTDGATVRVSGWFQQTSGDWAQGSYFIRLVDPDGAVTPGSSNIKFERVTETAAI